MRSELFLLQSRRARKAAAAAVVAVAPTELEVMLAAVGVETGVWSNKLEL